MPKEVMSKDFPLYIMTSDELEPDNDEQAIIEIVSPVLKKGKYLWVGIYNGNVILGSSSNQNSALTLSGKSIYGNGFEIDASGSNISSKAFGIISLTNASIDNAIVNGPTYSSYSGTYGSDNYAATIVCYDNATITNCHISMYFLS